MLLTALSLLLAPQVLPTAQDPATEIRAVDLKARIGFLASDSLEGRESGKRGGHAAAQYFAKEWARLGLEPIGEDDSYLLPFELNNGLTCYNTAGLLPGTDPALADQVLIIGGHHDHAGVGGPGAMGFPGEIHNGADDNASGTVTMLEIARHFAAQEKKPLRRIVFMAFTGEERGLWGSAHYTRNPRFALKDTIAMYNLDMVGRLTNNKLKLQGTGTAAEFDALVEDLNKKYKFALEKDPTGFGPSDHTSFYRAKVPVLHIFTGLHSDYHRPSDDVDKLNLDGMRKIAQFVEEIVQWTLDQDARPEYKEIRRARGGR